MQELEKILEEIRKAFEENTEYIADEDGCHHFVIDGCTATYLVNQIIRKHMNDGWISVEERLPNDGIDVEVTVRRGYRTIGYYNELFEEWYSTDESGLIDAIAWKEPSEPYRPERSEQ